MLLAYLHQWSRRAYISLLLQVVLNVQAHCVQIFDENLNVSALSNGLPHTLHTYCLVDLFVFEDTDALTGITNNIHSFHH